MTALLDGWLAMAPPHLDKSFLGTLPQRLCRVAARQRVFRYPNNEINLIIIQDQS